MVTRAATILAILLLLPATALAVSNVQLEKNGQPLTAYAGGQETINATIAYTPNSAALRTSILYPGTDGMQQVVHRVRECRATTCRKDITLAAQEEITIRINEDNRQEPTTKTFTLSVDDQKPEIKASINGCTSSCVYSQQSTISVNISDQGTGVDNTSVQVTINGEQAETTCNRIQGLHCTAPLTTSSDATIRVNAKDLAGNNAEQQTISARYDNQPPEIAEDGEPRFTNGLEQGLDEQPGGTELVIETVIQEAETPSITFTSEFVQKEGQCARNPEDNNNYVCTVAFQAPNEQYQGTGTLTIEDKAGNQKNTSIPLNIYQSDSETQPEFWTASLQPLKKIDPSTWYVNDQTLPVALTLKARGSPNAVPVRVFIDSCSLSGAAQGSARVTSDPTPPAGQKTTQFDIELDKQLDAFDNPDSDIFSSNITCEAKIYTRIGEQAFRQPEPETISFEPDFTSLPPPEEAIQQQIQDNLDKTEQAQKWGNRLHKFWDIYSTICSPLQAVQSAASAVMGVANIQRMVPGMQTTAAGTQKVSLGIEQINDQIVNDFGNYCKMMSCSPGGDNLYMDSIGAASQIGADSELGKALDKASMYGAGKENAEGLINPYKSIIVAGMTGCMPAIVTHVDNYLSISCQKTKCLQQVADGATSVQACNYAESQLKCKYFGGAIYHAIPYTQIWNGAMERVKSIFQNPYSVVGMASTGLCKLTGVDATGVLAIPCQLTHLTQTLNTFIKLGTDIKNTANAIQNIGASPSNYCDQIKDGSIVRQNPLPWASQNSYCNAGFTAVNYNGQRYLAAGETVCKCEQGLDEGAPENAVLSDIGGCKTSCSPAAIGSEAREVVAEKQQSCEAESTQPLRELDNWENTEEASKDLRRAQNEVDDINDIINDGEEQIRSSRRAAAQNLFSGDGVGAEGAIYITRDAVQDYLYGEGDPPTDDQLIILENTGHEELANNLRTLKESRTTVDNANQELGDAEGALKNATKSYRANRSKLKDEALEQQLNSTVGFLNRMYAGAATFGFVGGFIDRGLGIGFTNPGNIFGTIQSGLDAVKDPGLDQVESAICAGGPQQQEAPAITDATGRSAAFISGAISEDGAQYDYAIEAYVSLPNPVAKSATVQLRRGSQKETIDELRLDKAYVRTNSDALGTSLDKRYDTACIVFPEEIGKLLPIQPIGIDSDAQTLCAQLTEDSQ